MVTIPEYQQQLQDRRQFIQQAQTRLQSTKLNITPAQLRQSQQKGGVSQRLARVKRLATFQGQKKEALGKVTKEFTEQERLEKEFVPIKAKYQQYQQAQSEYRDYEAGRKMGQKLGYSDMSYKQAKAFGYVQNKKQYEGFKGGSGQREYQKQILERGKSIREFEEKFPDETLIKDKRGNVTGIYSPNMFGEGQGGSMSLEELEKLQTTQTTQVTSTTIQPQTYEIPLNQVKISKTTIPDAVGIQPGNVGTGGVYYDTKATKNVALSLFTWPGTVTKKLYDTVVKPPAKVVVNKGKKIYGVAYNSISRELGRGGRAVTGTAKNLFIDPFRKGVIGGPGKLYAASKWVDRNVSPKVQEFSQPFAQQVWKEFKQTPVAKGVRAVTGAAREIPRQATYFGKSSTGEALAQQILKETKVKDRVDTGAAVVATSKYYYDKNKETLGTVALQGLKDNKYIQGVKNFVGFEKTLSKNIAADPKVQKFFGPLTYQIGKEFKATPPIKTIKGTSELAGSGMYIAADPYFQSPEARAVTALPGQYFGTIFSKKLTKEQYRRSLDPLWESKTGKYYAPLPKYLDPKFQYDVALSQEKMRDDSRKMKEYTADITKADKDYASGKIDANQYNIKVNRVISSDEYKRLSGDGYGKTTYESIADSTLSGKTKATLSATAKITQYAPYFTPAGRVVLGADLFREGSIGYNFAETKKEKTVAGLQMGLGAGLAYFGVKGFSPSGGSSIEITNPILTKGVKVLPIGLAGGLGYADYSSTLKQTGDRDVAIGAGIGTASMILSGTYTPQAMSRLGNLWKYRNYQKLNVADPTTQKPFIRKTIAGTKQEVFYERVPKGGTKWYNPKTYKYVGRKPGTLYKRYYAFEDPTVQGFTQGKEQVTFYTSETGKVTQVTRKTAPFPFERGGVKEQLKWFKGTKGGVQQYYIPRKFVPSQYYKYTKTAAGSGYSASPTPRVGDNPEFYKYQTFYGAKPAVYFLRAGGSSSSSSTKLQIGGSQIQKPIVYQDYFQKIGIKAPAKEVKIANPFVKGGDKIKYIVLPDGPGQYGTGYLPGIKPEIELVVAGERISTGATTGFYFKYAGYRVPIDTGFRMTGGAAESAIARSLAKSATTLGATAITTPAIIPAVTSLPISITSVPFVIPSIVSSWGSSTTPTFTLKPSDSKPSSEIETEYPYSPPSSPRSPPSDPSPPSSPNSPLSSSQPSAPSSPSFPSSPSSPSGSGSSGSSSLSGSSTSTYVSPIYKPSGSGITKGTFLGALQRAYDVQVKRGGKFVTISKKPLPLGKAKQLGSKEVLATLAATFRLKTKGTTRESDIPFQLKGSLFRKPKGGTKTPQPLTFIERKSSRLGKGTTTKDIVLIRGSKKGKKKKRRGIW